MWPAIWMLPEKDIYGPWPRSGEIDIVETRGNAKSYPVGGRDRYSSAIHWGKITIASNCEGRAVLVPTPPLYFFVVEVDVTTLKYRGGLGTRSGRTKKKRRKKI